MNFTSLPQIARNTGRIKEITTVLAKFGLAPWMQSVRIDWIQNLFHNSAGQPIGEKTEEVRIREALTELGTTFIKLGQILSTRPDLVGPDLTAELQKLQSNTPADPPESVRKLIESELGSQPEELFLEFDDQAFASASVGQVHAAKLKDGTEIVVKVQHEGIEETIRNDLEIMKHLAELAEQYSPELKQYQPVDTISEFSKTLLHELDFNRELKNLQSFTRNFEEDQLVRIPNSYPELSSTRVLTMDCLDGISVSKKSELQSSDHDLSDVAMRGANMFLNMIFRDGFYHADPHPGNLMVLEGGAIGLLDCGMVGRVDDVLREQIEDMLIAAVNRDGVMLCDMIIRLGSVPPGFDENRMRADVDDFLSEYSTDSLSDFDVSGALNEMTRIIRNYEIILPSRVSLLIKVLVMLEGTAQNLNPDFSLAELLGPWQEQAIKHRFSPTRIKNRIQNSWREWSRLGESLPRELNDILSQIKRGRFDVHLEHRRMEQTINRMVHGILAAALFMGSSMLWSRNVPPVLWNISVPGAVGCFAAVFLGFRLLRAIKRSGDIEIRS